MCKSFLRGKLIALKAFREKDKNSVRVKLKLEIERLESEVKQNPLTNTVKQLDAIYDALKLLDAHQITQETLFSKQKRFECRDRPNKLLARILSDYPPKRQDIPLLDLSGKLRHSMSGSW